MSRLREWSACRNTSNSCSWTSEQWPENVRQCADDFAERLRKHASDLPVLHFVEWVDRWSMGDLFDRWLMPPDSSGPVRVHGNRFVLFAHSLPDGDKLAEYLAAAEPQQFDETDWFISRLREAVAAWDKLAQHSTVVILRFVVDASTDDEVVAESMRTCPDWLV